MRLLLILWLACLSFSCTKDSFTEDKLIEQKTPDMLLQPISSSNEDLPFFITEDVESSKPFSN